MRSLTTGKTEGLRTISTHPLDNIDSATTLAFLIELLETIATANSSSSTVFFLLTRMLFKSISIMSKLRYPLSSYTKTHKLVRQPLLTLLDIIHFFSRQSARKHPAMFTFWTKQHLTTCTTHTITLAKYGMKY